MRAILISIKPKWVAKILNGEKTIEIRKTMPKCDLPIDVYIYCTKEESLIYTDGTDWKGDYVDYKYYADYKGMEDDIGSGKVVAKFTLNKVEHFEYDTCSRDISGYWLDNGEVFKNKGTCLKSEELFNYIKSGDGYAWHIDKLEIFDKPKELSEFKKCQLLWNCDPHDCKTCRHSLSLTKAPQSWCYVEVNEND